jgi:hypothetical protein
MAKRFFVVTVVLLVSIWFIAEWLHAESPAYFEDDLPFELQSPRVRTDRGGCSSPMSTEGPAPVTSLVPPAAISPPAPVPPAANRPAANGVRPAAARRHPGR